MIKKITTGCLIFSLLPVMSLFAEDVATTTAVDTSSQADVKAPQVAAVSSSEAGSTVSTAYAVKKVAIAQKTVTKKPVDLSKLSCDIPKSVVLKKGVSDGASYAVTKLQTALVRSGYLTVTPNGYFGPATYAAVRKLQSDNNLKVTGIVGPYSLAKINEVLCNGVSSGVSTAQTGAASSSKKVAADTDTNTVSGIKPTINSFVIKTNSDGVQLYDVSVANADTVSVKAECPSSVVEVTTLVGLTKQKVTSTDSVCSKEKYLYAGDISGQGGLERKDSPLTFIDRDGVSSWFALDTGVTLYASLPYTVKACRQNVCVQKKSSVEVRDFFQKLDSSQLSIDSFTVDSTKKTFSVKASNFSHLTIKPGCPYIVQPVDSVGGALSDDASPCNIEKDVVADSSTVTKALEKTAETLSSYGFNFILKPVDGSYNDYAIVELTAKACTGIQAESVSSTTLKCVEKKAFLTVKDKTFIQASTTAQ